MSNLRTFLGVKFGLEAWLRVKDLTFRNSTYIPLNMATTLFNACCGNFGDFGSSKIESSFFWQLLALARVVFF